jgi:hypothetical protein
LRWLLRERGTGNDPAVAQHLLGRFPQLHQPVRRGQRLVPGQESDGRRRTAEP